VIIAAQSKEEMSCTKAAGAAANPVESILSIVVVIHDNAEKLVVAHGVLFVCWW
jgi:hypothetical protein